MGPRAWEVVDDHIEAARKERYAGVALRRRRSAQASGADRQRRKRRRAHNARRRGKGCVIGQETAALLARNGHEQIERTAKVLRASFDATLPLTKSGNITCDAMGYRSSERTIHPRLRRDLCATPACRSTEQRRSSASTDRLGRIHPILEKRTEDR